MLPTGEGNSSGGVVFEDQQGEANNEGVEGLGGDGRERCVREVQCT